MWLPNPIPPPLLLSQVKLQCVWKSHKSSSVWAAGTDWPAAATTAPCSKSLCHSDAEFRLQRTVTTMPVCWNASSSCHSVSVSIWVKMLHWWTGPKCSWREHLHFTIFNFLTWIFRKAVGNQDTQKPILTQILILHWLNSALFTAINPTHLLFKYCHEGDEKTIRFFFFFASSAPLCAIKRLVLLLAFDARQGHSRTEMGFH